VEDTKEIEQFGIALRPCYQQLASSIRSLWQGPMSVCVPLGHLRSLFSQLIN
jgi:hypothetical protein